LIENNEISEEVPVQHQTERLAARQRCVVQATGYKQGCRLVRFENEPTWNIVMLFNDKFSRRSAERPTKLVDVIIDM